MFVFDYCLIFQVIDDTRRQLRFVEELERLEYERRENREKEALIRLSKTKGKDKDTLVEKAKQVGNISHFIILSN